MRLDSSISPLATPEPWNDVADGYAEEMVPVLQEYARDAIDLLAVRRNTVVLDVACGPGTLCCLLPDQVARVDAIDFSPEMIRRLSESLDTLNIENIVPYCMDGQTLTFSENAYDYAFSMFGLMLFPDRLKGLREMCRVLKPGGQCAISSWTAIENSPLMNVILDTLAIISGQPFDKNGDSTAFNNEGLISREMQSAGFENVSVHVFRHMTIVEDVRSFWRFIERSAAPIALLRRAFSEEQWQEKVNMAIEHLTNSLPPLPTALGTEAYIGVGTKPGLPGMANGGA